MMAHNPISTSTQIRQSESNRLGRDNVSIAGVWRLGGETEFIAEILIIWNVWARGSAPPGRGGAPPPHDLSPRQPCGQHGLPPLRGKFQGLSKPNWSRKIASSARNRAASSARAAPNQAVRAASLAGSRTHFQDSPAKPR